MAWKQLSEAQPVFVIDETSPEPEVKPDVWDELATAYKEGVQSAYDQ